VGTEDEKKQNACSAARPNVGRRRKKETASDRVGTVGDNGIDVNEQEEVVFPEQYTFVREMAAACDYVIYLT